MVLDNCMEELASRYPAYHALRFVAHIRELGNRTAKRMWERGPFVAPHLLLEKDVWIRTGCSPGLDSDYDAIIFSERKLRPEYLSGRLNMSYHQRKLAGLCPLTGWGVAQLLIAIGAPRSALIYRAGGEPFGGEAALRPLREAFPNMLDKEMLAQEGELEPFANSSSALAAIDYIVSLSSDVFMPSHGGNMGRAIQGHRTYAGHRKSIKPNKRWMLPAMLDGHVESPSNTKIKGPTLAPEEVSCKQREAPETPEMRTEKRGRDVVAYPVPECMCRKSAYLPFSIK